MPIYNKYDVYCDGEMIMQNVQNAEIARELDLTSDEIYRSASKGRMVAGIYRVMMHGEKPRKAPTRSRKPTTIIADSQFAEEWNEARFRLNPRQKRIEEEQHDNG